MIVDQFERMLDGHANTSSRLWDEIVESGFLDLLTAEEDGGAGLSLLDAFPIAFALGKRAIDLPVIETMIARALLGAKAPGEMIVLSDRRAWRSDIAERATVLVGGVGRSSLMEGEVASEASGSQLRAMAAAAMAGRMAGGLQAISDMTISYALTRKQFGREIARFQAVQQQIAVMAEETAAASTAASTAFRGELIHFDERAAAVAKLRTCQAADVVAAIGHAVHGAIGMSEEFVLGRHTAQLRSWSLAYGGRLFWEAKLGSAVLQGSGGFLDAVRF
jgi:acyl-CoA dehydrogenase